MEKNVSFQDYLREQLHRLFPDSKDNGAQTEVCINCPLCKAEGGDDTNHHMYISIDDNKPLMYNCFKNSSHRGILSGDVLYKFVEIDSGTPVDPMLLEEIDAHNEKRTLKSRYTLSKPTHYNMDNIFIPDSEVIEVKRKYICNRIGVDLTIEQLLEDKVVFSINELLTKNFVKDRTRYQKDLDLLDFYFVGFLTNNNTTVIFRNMVKGKINLPEYFDTRYIKYSIIKNAPSGYYIIPTQNNIYKHIDIHLAEGTFDILSIFYNLRGANKENNIYGSIGGNSYINMIEYFLCSVGLIDVDFHIYIDNDIKPYVIPSIKNALAPLGIDCYIHSNTFPGEKDFGVPKEKIKEFYYKLT